MLAHLGGPGGAVEADDVDAQRLERGQRRADLGAHQHGARGLDGDAHDDRHLAPGRLTGPLGADHGGLGLQQVLAGLDDERVGPTREQALGAGLVAVAQGGEGGVAEAGQLRARPHRAEHVARPVGRREPVGDLPRDAGAGHGELADAVGDAVLPQGGQVGAEGVRLDGVGAGGEVGLVDLGHDVGPGHVEDLVAALEVVEVVEGEVEALQHGAHAAVGDDNAGLQRAAEIVHLVRIWEDADTPLMRPGLAKRMASRSCP